MILLQHCPIVSDLYSQQSPPVTLTAPAMGTYLLAMNVPSMLPPQGHRTYWFLCPKCSYIIPKSTGLKPSLLSSICSNVTLCLHPPSSVLLICLIIVYIFESSEIYLIIDSLLPLEVQLHEQRNCSLQ